MTSRRDRGERSGVTRLEVLGTGEELNSIGNYGVGVGTLEMEGNLHVCTLHKISSGTARESGMVCHVEGSLMGLITSRYDPMEAHVHHPGQLESAPVRVHFVYRARWNFGNGLSHMTEEGDGESVGNVRDCEAYEGRQY